MFEVALAILSAYRAAYMLALEEGPFGAFLWIRDHIDPTQSTWVGRGLNCPKCISVWASLLFASLIPFATWQVLVLNWFGIAGGALIVYMVMLKWDS